MAENVDLAFDGLDTFSVVELVGTLSDVRNGWANLSEVIRMATKF